MSSYPPEVDDGLPSWLCRCGETVDGEECHCPSCGGPSPAGCEHGTRDWDDEDDLAADYERDEDDNCWRDYEDER